MKANGKWKSCALSTLGLLTLIFQICTYETYCYSIRHRLEGVIKLTGFTILLMLWMICVLRIIWTDPGRVPPYLCRLSKTPDGTEHSPRRGSGKHPLRPGQAPRSASCTVKKHSSKFASAKANNSPSQPIEMQEGVKTTQHKMSLDLYILSELTQQKPDGPSHPSEVLGQQLSTPRTPRIRGFDVCGICGCFKPPRAHHCKECGRCVLRKDHHCTILGSCIGFYNHKYYILMLYYSALLLGVACGDIVSGFIMSLKEGNFCWLYLLFSVISLPELMIIIPLLISHTMLLSRGITSIEMAETPDNSPFDMRSCVQNIEQVFGKASVSWIVPVAPRDLTSNGVSFPVYEDQAQMLINPLLLS